MFFDPPQEGEGRRTASMIRKSGYRFSDRIMLKQQGASGWGDLSTRRAIEIHIDSFTPPRR
jgi:hypothetical protein